MSKEREGKMDSLTVGNPRDKNWDATDGNLVSIQAPISENKMMTAQDVAEALSVSTNAVYQWAKCGRLPSVKLGRSVRFAPKIVNQILSGLRTL